jgi:excisionase family DNA binding protein
MDVQHDSEHLEPLLTVGDVAALLRVSKGTVYGLVRSGDLSPVPLPIRKTRFRRADVMSLLGY